MRLQNSNEIFDIYSIELKESSDVFTVGAQTKKDNLILLTLQDIYNDMIEVLDIGSFTFGFQSMLGTGITFFYTIFTSFLCYKAFQQDEIRSNAIGSVYWWIFLGFFQLLLILGSECMMFEAEKILKHLNKIVKRSKDQSEINILLSFCDCIQRHPPVFTSGLFNYNLELSFSVNIKFSLKFTRR